jgi:Transcription factor WhiB
LSVTTGPRLFAFPPDALRLHQIIQEQGACVGSAFEEGFDRNADPFFTTNGAAAARAVCATCKVADECGAFAKLTGQTHGTWGPVERELGQPDQERTKRTKRPEPAPTEAAKRGVKGVPLVATRAEARRLHRAALESSQKQTAAGAGMSETTLRATFDRYDLPRIPVDFDDRAAILEELYWSKEAIA